MDSTRHGPSHYNGETGTITAVLTDEQLSELKSGRPDIKYADQAMLVLLDSTAQRTGGLDAADLFGLPVINTDVVLEETE